MSNINVNTITPFSGDTVSISGSLSIAGTLGGALNSTLEISSSKTYLSGSTSQPLGLGISGSILPGENNTYDLGSPSKVWRELFLSENSLAFVSSSGEVTKVSQDDAKQVFEGRKAAAGMAMKRVRGFSSASTFIDLEATNITAGDRIDIKVADTFEALSISTGRTSLGPKESVPLELTGSLDIRPANNAKHQFHGKYQFSGQHATGSGALVYDGNVNAVEISGSLSILPQVAASGQLDITPQGFIYSGDSAVLEQGVVTQPGEIAQSFTIGLTPSGEVTRLRMEGVGNDEHIKILNGVIVRVLDGCVFKISPPQPNIAVNYSQGSVTVSDPNIFGGGDLILNPNSNSNPTTVIQPTLIPYGQAATWVAGNTPGTYLDTSGVPANDGFGVQIGGALGVVSDGIFIDGVEIAPSYGTECVTLTISDQASLAIVDPSGITSLTGIDPESATSQGTGDGIQVTAIQGETIFSDIQSSVQIYGNLAESFTSNVAIVSSSTLTQLEHGNGRRLLVKSGSGLHTINSPNSPYHGLPPGGYWLGDDGMPVTYGGYSYSTPREALTLTLPPATLGLSFKIMNMHTNTVYAPNGIAQNMAGGATINQSGFYLNTQTETWALDYDANPKAAIHIQPSGSDRFIYGATGSLGCSGSYIQSPSGSGNTMDGNIDGFLQGDFVVITCPQDSLWMIQEQCGNWLDQD